MDACGETGNSTSSLSCVRRGNTSLNDILHLFTLQLSLLGAHMYMQMYMYAHAHACTCIHILPPKRLDCPDAILDPQQTAEMERGARGKKWGLSLLQMGVRDSNASASHMKPTTELASNYKLQAAEDVRLLLPFEDQEPCSCS